MTMKKELEMLRKKEQTLIQRVREEREKNAGYEQIAKLHSAYISILLNKLGATNENGVLITSKDVYEAMSRYEVRATQDENGWHLFCADINE